MSQEAITYGANLTSPQWRVDRVAAVEISPRGKRHWSDLNDVRDLRDSFLTLQPDDLQGLRAFLNRAGTWSEKARSVPLPDIWRHQAIIRYVLTGNKAIGFGESKVWAQLRFAEMLLDALHIHSVTRQGNQAVPTKVEIAAYDVRGALYLSVWQDLVRQMRFRYCARKDCPDHGVTRAPFEATRPDRIYCSWYCGHIVAMRNKRATERKRKRR